MKQEYSELQKQDYFNPDEDIFIHKSNNLDFNGVMHSHSFIEVSYVISGSATHRVQDQSYPVKKGNVIFIDYKVPHAFTFDPEANEPFLTYDLLFTPDFFHIPAINSSEFISLASSYLFSPLFDEFLVKSMSQHLIQTNTKEFSRLFGAIYHEFTHREKGFQNLIRGYLIELITLIFREIDKKQPSFTHTHQEMVDKAIAYMRNHFHTSISLDEIVSGIFLSKNYFRQLFKKTTGMSISSYIQELRIQEACRLLEITSDTSTVIAHKCGFNDTKFFYQTFKNVTGMTPSEYRKKHIHLSEE